MHLAPPTTDPRARRSRRSAAVAGLAVALVAASALTVPAVAEGASGSDAAAAPAGRFVSIAPTRVLDTRTSGGALGNGVARVVDVGAAFSGTASAVVVNLTVASPTAPGYLTAYPAGTPRPTASSINFSRGQNRANAVTVAVGTGSFQDKIAVYASLGGSVQVVVDVVGWYTNGAAGSPAGDSYQPLSTPARLFDSREAPGPLGNTYPTNTGIVTVDYDDPAFHKTIAAVVVNLTVTAPATSGYITTWDGAGAPPTASTLNYSAGQTVANLAVIPVRCTDSKCTKVQFSLRNFVSPRTHVIGDISGVYATPSSKGLLFRPTAPTRVTDTRHGFGFGALDGGARGATDVSANVTAATKAVVINVAGVAPTVPTYLTVWPSTGTRPTVSNLNLGAGEVAANAAQIRLSGSQFATYNYSGTIDVVIDLAGYFEADPAFSSAAPAAAAAPVGAARVAG